MLIPSEPKKQKCLDVANAGRLSRWVEYFRNLSSRITVIERDDPGMSDLLNELLAKTRRQRDIPEDELFVGWPTKDIVAFVLIICESPPNRECVEPKQDMSYIFCLGDRAFHPGHFEWDGAAHREETNSTWSLDGYTADLLSWDFIRGLIESRITELETSQSIPPPPTTR